MFFKIGVFKASTTFAGKPPLQSLFDEITSKQVFFSDYCEILKINFLYSKRLWCLLLNQ